MEKIKGKILLVEDDENLGYVIKDNLRISGYNVQHCIDGEEGWEAFKKDNFDLCILDIMLPRKDGFTLASEIRKENEMIPILFLSAKSMQDDKINGFRIGADDYITKPFSIEELTCRIEVFLKRSRQELLNSKQEIFKIGHCKLDYPNLTLYCPGEEKTLTQKEADILKLFCLRKKMVLKRDEILKSVWGDDDYFLGRSLDVFISKLRKYLKGDPTLEIINYHGVGFKLEEKLG